MDARVSNEVNYSGSSWGRQQAASHWDRPVDVTVENVVRTFGTTPALHGVSLEIESGELVALARAFRLRQDDSAQDSRRPRRADLRPRAIRRRGRAQADGAAAECRAGVSELCAVPPYERARQYWLRLARTALGAAAEPQGNPQARARAARSRAAQGAREALSLAALRRPAPACGFRTGARHRAARALARRALRRSRRQGAARPSSLAVGDPQQDRTHHGVRHPRPGRGPRACRPRGCDERRQDRADRHA